VGECGADQWGSTARGGGKIPVSAEGQTKETKKETKHNDPPERMVKKKGEGVEIPARAG